MVELQKNLKKKQIFLPYFKTLDIYDNPIHYLGYRKKTLCFHLQHF